VILTLQIITGVIQEIESLLSAVVGSVVLIVACGVLRWVVRLRAIVTTAELDFLKPVSGGLGAASLP